METAANRTISRESVGSHVLRRRTYGCPAALLRHRRRLVRRVQLRHHRSPEPLRPLLRRVARRGERPRLDRAPFPHCRPAGRTAWSQPGRICERPLLPARRPTLRITEGAASAAPPTSLSSVSPRALGWVRVWKKRATTAIVARTG